MAGFIPVILGSGAYATIRAMAPSVVEKFIRAGIKGFRKVPANKPVSYTHLTLPTIYSV